jgi:ribosomal protein L11 methyltransferase
VSAAGDVSAPVVEVRVEFARADAELAQLAIGEFSPGGFVEGESAREDIVTYSVFLPVGDEARLTSWLAQAGVQPLGEPMTAIVPAGWDERWKEFHQAVVIGGLWIGPPWQREEMPAGLKPVIIEPAQGFGTGAHPTTRLVLSLLQEQPRSGVLDLGCGSGVLAVAAALLGFGPITAIDNDPVAIEATRDNLVRNDVDGLVRAHVLDALQQDIPRADLVLANVLLEPLVRIAPKLTAPRLILSGLLASQADECADAYQGAGYVVRERRDRDGWAALVLDHAREHAAVMTNKPLW